MGGEKKASPAATASVKTKSGASIPPKAAPAKPAAPKGPGAPTKFDELLAQRIYELALAGQTDEQIAREVGISVRTLGNWKTNTEGFLQAIKDAKGFADEMVKASLFRRAVGYSHPAAKFFMVKQKVLDKKGGVTFTEKVVVQPYTEHYPPDTTACIFWLKNRQKEDWRDRNELTGADGKPLTGGKLTVRVVNLTTKAPAAAKPKK